MKLFKTKMLLDSIQWMKIFLIMSILILLLYIGATIASLCGSTYFILNYQNTQMDKIEAWLTQYNLYHLAMWAFSTIEFCILISFINKRLPSWYYILAFYVIAVPFYYFLHVGQMFFTLYPFLFYLTIPLIEQLKDHKKIIFKEYLFSIVRLLIAMLVVFVLQILIFIIKAGYLTFESTVMNLSATFIYAIEYDIALAVILVTILLVYREKGACKLCHHAGLSSQTSTKQSQKSSMKKLTKTQKSKLRFVYFKFYVTQIGAFLLLMILPFLLGKVLEFLVMYLAFATARYVLGFKYSVHFKKESLCITVGVIVFGILSLAVPFFYVILLIAVLFGILLAVTLHLSYKYKGFYLFAKMAKPDKFALLYVYFDGDLSEHHVRKMCCYKGLDINETNYIWDFVQGCKLSYMAWKYNYSQRMIIYLLDDAIEKLTAE